MDVLGSCSSPSRSTTTPKTQITTSSTTKATTATTQSTPPTGSQQTHLSVAVWTLIALITAILLVLLVVFFYKRYSIVILKEIVCLSRSLEINSLALEDVLCQASIWRLELQLNSNHK